MTEIQRPTKWDTKRGRVRKRITGQGKVNIAKIYDKRLAKGERRAGILADLSSRHDRDMRTIERYISEGKQMIAQQEQLRKLESIRAKRFEQHFDGLAEVAKKLHDIQRFLISYGKDETFTVSELEPISGFFYFEYQPPPRKPPIDAAIVDGVADVHYPEVVHFFDHLHQDRPELGLEDWKELVTRTMPQAVIDLFSYLGNTARFRYCPACPVCKDIGD